MSALITAPEHTQDEAEALSNFIQSVRSSFGGDWRDSGTWLSEHPWWWYLQTLHLAIRAKDAKPDEQRKILKTRRDWFLIAERQLGRPPIVDDVRADFPDREMSEPLLALIARDLEVVKQPIRRRSRHEVFMERMAKIERQLDKSRAKSTKKAAKKKRSKKGSKK